MRAAIVLFCGVLPSFSQAIVRGGANEALTAVFHLPAASPPVIANAPYSGQEQWDRVQTGPGGTHIISTRTGSLLFRDAQGRTRIERMVGDPGPVVIEITDPVARCQYILDAPNKIAHRMALPDAAPRTATAVRQENQTARPRVASRTLGSRIESDLLLEGNSWETTFDPGTAGNLEPFTAVSETWTSPDLKLMVKSKSVDPRVGEETFHIANLNRAAPDPALFAPPLDYTVIDEFASFTLTYK